ncbi:hypothetical protein PSMK_03670 [Phycisphaera mikurensis NBRC 102666]|uniref:Uncharacterized protein n=1 Tax=Phycisphaera mikurensis (strain NBRC 102666 / KCTC 22515 / FYK2301M01) TaxID=1142394 RepID=I0IB88_PHYMF|nr:hypothetical protein PSMK_03670 [Phycisphaera mikurensis NBRC 102666]
MTHHTLESPWLLMAALAAAAAVAFFAVRGRPVAWLLLPALLLACAAGSVLLAGAVVTDREAADAAVRELVAAASPFDPAAFDARVTPDAELLGPSGDPWLRLAEVRERVREYAGSGRSIVHDVKELEVDPVQDLPGGSASTLALLRVASKGGPSGLPTLTTWELDLRRDAAAPWRVRGFRWLQLNLQPPPDVHAWR